MNQSILMKIKILVTLFLLSATTGFTQWTNFSAPVQTKNIPHINLALNRISNGRMDVFYDKLLSLKQHNNGVVTIVHIGDSHIQADFLTSVMRNGLQHFFGNAGRGLVFPYQLAKSNAPADINSTSNVSWNYNRLAHPEISINNGIAGFCIQTNRPGAKINISLRDNEYGSQSFNKLTFFTDTVTSWLMQTEDSNDLTIIPTHTTDSSYQSITLQNNKSSFTLSSQTTGNTQSFYGASLVNNKPGVIYHAIGVNGAKYEQYNNTPLFWKQLPALNADLYIISLGTNEAQNDSFIETDFLVQVAIFLENLKKTSPDATILITTPQDSYKGEGSNGVMKKLNFSLLKYCMQSNIAIWDLYRITNGYGSAKKWFKKGLMSKDKVHFTSAGYKIQGQLLLNAMAKGYNNYVNFKTSGK